MEAVKAILMGCGAIALLSVVGCVGLTGAGYYALDQAIEEQEARQALSPSQRRGSAGDTSYSPDPFGDYDGNTYGNTDGAVDDWGDETER